MTKNGAGDSVSPDTKRRRLSKDDGFLKKRILVTGGAGFIGSHLVERLLREGHEVLCVDNYFSGDKDNVMKHIGNPRFELIRHDVTDMLTVEVAKKWFLNFYCSQSFLHSFKVEKFKDVLARCEFCLNFEGTFKYF